MLEFEQQSGETVELRAEVVGGGGIWVDAKIVSGGDVLARDFDEVSASPADERGAAIRFTGSSGDTVGVNDVASGYEVTRIWVEE